MVVGPSSTCNKSYIRPFTKQVKPCLFDEIAMIINAESESITTAIVTKRCIVF